MHALLDGLSRVQIYVHLTFGDHPIIAVATSVGDAIVVKTVWIIPDVKKIHLFDGKTGEALILFSITGRRTHFEA
jgi:hypothetical protein